MSFAQPSKTETINHLNSERSAAQKSTVVLTHESFKRCLKDEKKAQHLDACVETLDKKTAEQKALSEKLRIANFEIAKLRGENQAKTEEILRRDQALQKPGFWWGVALGGAAASAISLLIYFIVIK